MPRRMISLRLPPSLVSRIDRLAEGEGITRTEWIGQTLSREALRAAAHPQTGDEAVEGSS